MKLKGWYASPKKVRLFRQPQGFHHANFIIITCRTRHSFQQCAHQLYMRVGIVFMYDKHLYGPIISLKGKDLVHKTSINPPYFIEVPVPSQTKSERSCILIVVRAIDFASQAF